ncbi:MAG: response regulator transcription factor [Bacteroidota bacterium]
MKTKIALVDDHVMSRETMAQVINRYQHFEVVMQASNGNEFIEKVKKAEELPDIVVLDLLMPEMDGFDTALWIQEHRKYFRVLVLSMTFKYNMMVRMLQAGARGILTKQDDLTELEYALNMLRQRGLYINKHVSFSMYRELMKNKSGALGHDRITNMEFRFLRLCCSELTYRAIADQLNVSPRTVDTHRDNLFEKLKLRSRAGLIMYAIQMGIVDLDNLDPVVYQGKAPE